ncbi:MAG: DUF4296 domain-containing protein [Flavobacteriaceae bacterium]|nr:DUF4296 domain-containing protein [Flavobacteriaceae bacterium]
MKKIGVAIVLLVFVGCQDVKKPEPPENLIPQDKMVEILAEAYLGNAAKSINNRMLRTRGVYLDSVLYRKFDIDSLQFVRSNAFYTTDLDLYADILTQVEERLVARKAIVDSLYEIEKKESMRKKDSIRRQDSIRVRAMKKENEGELSEPVQDEEE